MFIIFIIRLQSQTKKFLVYKTKLTFKISENRNFFFSYSLLDRQSRMVFSVGEGPKCHSAAVFPCSSVYGTGITFNLYPASYEYLLFFPLRN